MKQLEFSFVATLLVLPSFFQLIISLLLLLSSAYIVWFHTPSHGTATRSKQKLIMNAYAFSIAPFPSLSFLLPPFISIYFYDSYLWSTTSCCILVKLLSIHSVERIACIFCYVFIVFAQVWSSRFVQVCTSTSIPNEQAQIAAL